VHDWISQFLHSRSQQVVLNGEYSSSIPVTLGIPQGTVLGPLLFLIYIDDLPEHVSKSRIRLFADDCIIYKQILTPNDAELLQEDINSIAQWASLWQMRFNVTKCCYIHFPPLKYTISLTPFMVLYCNTQTAANILESQFNPILSGTVTFVRKWLVQTVY